jgi:hypothetical protein
MTQHGSADHAERIAIGELLKQGWSRLGALIGGHVASFGKVCFQTDTRLHEKLRRPDGRPYHRESIARKRRELRDAGVITSERVKPNGKLPEVPTPKGPKVYKCTNGTTLKEFNWSAIARKNPWTRREMRSRRIEQALAARASGDAVLVPRPRYSAVIARPEYEARPTQIDPELARMRDRAIAAIEQREQRTTGRSAPVPRRTHDPPE